MQSNVAIRLKSCCSDPTLASGTHDPPSPADSGYASAISSPESPEKRAGSHVGNFGEDIWMHGDGNRSDSEDPFCDDVTSGTEMIGSQSFTLFTIPPLRRTSCETQSRTASLPKRLGRPKVMPSSLFNPVSVVRQRQRPSTPGFFGFSDRFIPARPLGTTLHDKFKTTKHPHELTPTEKLLRHRSATDDAFRFRPRTIPPLGPEFRSPSVGERQVSRNRVATVLGPLDQNRIEAVDGQVGGSTIWTVGLGGTAVDNGRGQSLRSGTNAPLYRATFPTIKPRTDEELSKHEARLAAALDLDRAQRILNVNVTHLPGQHSAGRNRSPLTQWNGTEWVNDGPVLKPRKTLGTRNLPNAPFKVLDAPNLRDDFYCSIIAYSPTCQALAVGLGDLLYAWSETRGVQLLSAGTDVECHLTSVSFSSTEGGKAILAFGRSNGTLGLMSLYDDPDPSSSRTTPMPRFEVSQPAPIACISWKPVCTIRPSKSQIHPNIPVKTEDLLVGDELGNVYYYAVEWPERWEVERYNWAGAMTPLLRISVHSQQICGLAWSLNGEEFATGGNDNLCCLFKTAKVLEVQAQSEAMNGEPQAARQMTTRINRTSDSSVAETQVRLHHSTPPILGPGSEKHRWIHGAAVKAIAFCPWQDSLVATGGGSNDKCIHFFHTRSGAALASISVSAQVTSLIWSTTRREIAATFGYAQPEHPIRIAVFSWPECQQVAAIPWAGEHRALYAIPYPNPPSYSDSSRDRRDYSRAGSTGPAAPPGRTSAKGRDKDMVRDDRSVNDSGIRLRRNTVRDGCIIVASSDKSVKFHEIWSTEDKKVTVSGPGILGGSDILEGLENIFRDCGVIR